MPLKLNVGVCRKIGQPDYGSLGATCNIEIELSSSLLQEDLAGFQRQVRSAYDACREAVHDELARNQQTNGHAKPSSNSSQTAAPAQPQYEAPPEGNGHNGNGSRSITEKQATYVRRLAGQISGLGVRRLETLAGNMYGKPLVGLTSFEASGLIDCLKAIKSGEVDLKAALGGATT